jgi:hypothetical protein
MHCEATATAKSWGVARGADSRPSALSDRYERGVDTASRSSKYPGLNSGATTSSANTSAYPLDQRGAQGRAAVTPAGLRLIAQLLLGQAASSPD